MVPNIVCRTSAFKHGVTEADIRCAFATARYIGVVEDDGNRYLLIGFDTRANPIEVMYNEFGENGKNVFHAMSCRARYLPLLNG